ncbi:MAG TPA: hypothetical protein ENJ85_05140 [Oceanithermus profundus]|uniref:DUF1508 domain-containing protein n=1 Tax=Oceanithermus profundus TaxID=187137 RepID=A0A7C5SRE3_9DEIN|nr:hypothetical protein [Oceanithermus profundus]
MEAKVLAIQEGNLTYLYEKGNGWESWRWVFETSDGFELSPVYSSYEAARDGFEAWQEVES